MYYVTVHFGNVGRNVTHSVIWKGKMKMTIYSKASASQEHFQTIMAILPPKNMYNKFFTSCVISNPYPSPTTACQEAPNFLSIVSFIIRAAF